VKMKKLAMVAAVSLLSTGAFAAGYGAAGCGLGSMVLGDQDGFMQVFAATTNGTSGSQTFGISSGTSNCGGSGKTPTQFIEVNKAALSLEAAQGQGESVAALSEIYGCSDAKEFGMMLKANYGEIFKAQEATEIRSNIEALLKNSSVSCDLV
jgi:hypothetical protein